MNFLRFLVFFFLFSCEDNFQEIQNINSKNTLPVGITENLKLIYTDSAKVKAILYSSLNKDFTNKIFPYSEFPNGIKITFFDKDNNETNVISDYAIMYSKTNIVDMKGNVIINNYDGSELKTSQLFWDPDQEWLFTEKKFTFKNIDYDIAATRLDANRSFTIFNTGKLDGKVLVEDN
ncbi:LPS export ABC transporter periplasmic protein LptC [Flavobacteriaceae bacterium]|nr:LPS export ABC transporter periplasmic protein LptC [Flavobacteriaceae bacterium]MDB4601194.1 LPS export ABC transporter periplasmic protein LptC [Flavobacteriaceae bacterium]MDC0554811.1 LPS export ABC transporter periplasmic protein LptC [Flavobacteriaceae bacterium]|tara:strand:+ start:1463 stop:1993 length:531 start_codon:yes stop_codon:yes gene_type:complete